MVGNLLDLRLDTQTDELIEVRSAQYSLSALVHRIAACACEVEDIPEYVVTMNLSEGNDFR